MANMKQQIEEMLTEARLQYRQHLLMNGGKAVSDLFWEGIERGDCDKDDFIVGYMTARRGHG